jgi:putative hydrolase of the HAD superfamily
MRASTRDIALDDDARTRASRRVNACIATRGKSARRVAEVRIDRIASWGNRALRRAVARAGHWVPRDATRTMRVVIRAVLFDFGGVILSSPFEAFAAYERRAGLPEGFLRSVNATDPDTNAWARLERSELSIDEFVVAFEGEATALGHRVDGSEVIACLRGEVRPRMVRAVQRCRERYATALLTNNFLTGTPDWSSGGSFHELVDLFDAVVESSRLGCRKPERRFYELALEELEILPEEAVFLDDLGVNLKPAREMGMATIKVVDPDVALDELSAVVGLDL